jgi:hypothetical protein
LRQISPSVGSQECPIGRERSLQAGRNKLVDLGICSLGISMTMDPEKHFLKGAVHTLMNVLAMNVFPVFLIPKNFSSQCTFELTSDIRAFAASKPFDESCRVRLRIVFKKMNDFWCG